MSNSEIASYLHLSEGTAKRHLTSRADPAKKALMSGLITFRAL
jgi:DNA-binding CsgD family transcriptional regulator